MTATEGSCSKVGQFISLARWAPMLLAGVIPVVTHCMHVPFANWMPALVHGQTLQQGYAGTAAQLLQAYPDSPYTAFLISPNNHTEALDQHCCRLVGGLSALCRASAFPNASQPSSASCPWGEAGEEAHAARVRILAAIQLAVSSVRGDPQSTAGMPVMMTVVLDNRPDSTSLGEVVAHAATMKVQEPVPIEIACVAPQRCLPEIKHTNWVCQRQKYASLVPATAAEGILCTEDGQLLEGFISNLFVVQQSPAGPVVRTAIQGVLAGTKQKEVLDACEALQITTVCKAPLQHERHLWTEAFLTNAVRGIRPVKRIVCPAQNAIGWKEWEIDLPSVGPQSVYHQLQSCLQQNYEANTAQL